MSPLASRTEILARTLRDAARDHAPAAFSSSLSAEDMVVTDAILSAGIDIEIFTLDTGRLHGDTLELIQKIKQRYGYAVRVYTPQADAVAHYIARHGRDGFYDSPELRRECCHIRKVEPLQRALAGKGAWVTGLRSVAHAREAISVRQFDAAYGLVKVNPLATWTEEDVWEYVRANDVPCNRLYDQGYRSIGCAPCSRPTTPGEEVRAGRWWWEQGAVRECGLHVSAEGKLVRTKQTA
ncbi:MAG TPA: phosphoadenylyl-sulfate reductase [Burkholderiales bacterium]|nr:phosphoadenylyl-sulfate reductase [Burkholderiales bacterium]